MLAPAPSPSLVVNLHCQLGENPLWDAATSRLYWTDITAGQIHFFSPADGANGTLYRGPAVGGFTQQTDGRLLLFRVNDIALLESNGDVKSLRRVTDPGMERFNDVIADPEGRVFAGTIGKTDESGALYRLDRDGSLIKLFSGTGCSNGMGFSPDLRHFYWTCSTRNRIYRFDYDRATGDLANETVFHQAGDGEGIVDGLTVDAEGNVWSARWDGAAVFKHDPAGEILERIPLPVSKVTSLTFGGTDLDSLFITTAGGSPADTSLAGALFLVMPGVRSLAEFKSRCLQT